MTLGTDVSRLAYRTRARSPATRKDHDDQLTQRPDPDNADRVPATI